jgi:hypothetical protein
MKGAIMTRQQAGSKGGRATLAKHGRRHFQQIGKAGAMATWGKYKLEPIGQSGWAMVARDTNQVRAFVNFKGR